MFANDVLIFGTPRSDLMAGYVNHHLFLGIKIKAGILIQHSKLFESLCTLPPPRWLISKPENLLQAESVLSDLINKLFRTPDVSFYSLTIIDEPYVISCYV